MKNSISVFFALSISLMMIQCKSPTASTENQAGNAVRETEETPFKPASQFFKNLDKKGVDFYSRGNEPGWSLDFFNDGHIEYTTLSDMFSNFSVSSADIVKSIQGNTTIYSISSQNTEIRVDNIPCQDNMSGQKFTHTIVLKQNGKELKGCGMYVPDYGLDGNFSFVEYRDQTGKKKDAHFQTTPTINFDFENDQIGGSDGCNRYGGKFIFLGKEIKTGNMLSTLMACPGKDDSHLISGFLSASTFTYHLNGDQLTLRNKEGVSIIWKK